MNHASMTFTGVRLGAGLTSPLTITNTAWAIAYSTGLATTAGTVAAEFDNGNAAVVFANDGRTAAVGIVNDVIADKV